MVIGYLIVVDAFVADNCIVKSASIPEQEVNAAVSCGHSVRTYSKSDQCVGEGLYGCYDLTQEHSGTGINIANVGIANRGCAGYNTD